MSDLNNANKAQQEVMRELSLKAWDCPPGLDKEAFDKYQAEVLQPLRNQILELAD
jgi:hypothetical protein